MNSLINFALLKEQLKRFWIIAVIPLLFYILFTAVPVYQTGNDMQQSANMLMNLLSMKNKVMIAASIAVPFITVFVSFSYLFQVKSTIAMHSYPFNKNQLFFTNIISGLILIVIPLIVFCIILAISPVEMIKQEVFINGGATHYYGPRIDIPSQLFSGGLNDKDIINTVPVITAFFFRTLLTFVFYYSVFLTAAFVSGDLIIFGKVSAALPFIPVGLALIWGMAAYFYCFGYETSGLLIEKTASFTNPVLFPTIFDYYSNTYIDKATALYPYILSYISIAVALFAVSLWCSHIRKQERATDSIVFVPLKNILIFVLSVFGMIVIGAFSLMMFKNVIVMYIALISGFILTYFVAQMIAEKSFNVFCKSRELINFGSVAVVLFISVMAVTKFDLSGYSRYSPEPEDVEGVYLSYPNQYFNGNLNPVFKEDFFITDSEIISETADIHKKIIGAKKELRDVFLQNMTVGNISDKYGLIKGQHFVFKLNSGKFVTRLYTLPKSFMDETGLSDLIDMDKVILSTYHSFKSPEIIAKIEVDYRDKKDGPSETITIEGSEKINSVLAEIKKDIVISTINYQKTERERIERSRAEQMALEQESFPRISGCVRLNDSYTAYEYYTYDYFNLENCENTERWLRQEGYL